MTVAAGVGVAHPWVLILLPLAAAPLLVRGIERIAHPRLDLVGSDRLSALVEGGIRAAGALAIALLVVGLAAPYRDGRSSVRTTSGAQVVIVLDRSRSMDDTFAGQSATETGEMSKARAASDLLLDFVAARPDNHYGVVEFSTSPIYALPLTDSDEAVRAALTAATGDGLALTAMSGALGMASSYFEGEARDGARVVLLVSDGAAVIPPDAAGPIRRWFAGNGLSLYWIYMRTEGHPSLRAAEGGAPDRDAPPEQLLHEYFQSLDVPYRAYEADNASAMRQAISDVGELARTPMRTRVELPRQELATVCYALALGLVVLLLAARAATVRRWT